MEIRNEQKHLFFWCFVLCTYISHFLNISFLLRFKTHNCFLCKVLCVRVCVWKSWLCRSSAAVEKALKWVAKKRAVFRTSNKCISRCNIISLSRIAESKIVFLCGFCCLFIVDVAAKCYWLKILLFIVFYASSILYTFDYWILSLSSAICSPFPNFVKYNLSL